MCLGNLAQHLVNLSVDDCTPALVMPRGVEVREAFLIELANEISKRDSRPLRFDWLSNARGFWAPIKTRATVWRARRIDAKLNRSNAASNLQVTASLARPDQPRLIVVGLCDTGSQLPEWSRALQVEFS